MTPLVLDVETLPLVASLNAPYPRAECFPPSNYKNAEAIDGWHVQNESKWRQNREKECSVNPRLGRILCAGTSDGMHYATTEGEEPDAMRFLWQKIAEADGRVVTWNGAFDLRFLVVRSALLHVLPTVPASTIRAWFKRYEVFAHFDVKSILLNGDVRVAGEGLDEWSKAFGLPGKPDGIDGSSVAWLYAEGQHDEIKKYCADDVANTQAMYHALVPFFGGDR